MSAHRDQVYLKHKQCHQNKERDRSHHGLGASRRMKEQVNHRMVRTRAHTRSGLWVSFSLSVAIYSASADTILLKSGEKVKGQITSESDLSRTIATETSPGKMDKTIAK